MKRRVRKIGTPTVILLTVLVIVGGIAALNYMATRNVTSSHISLPRDTEATTPVRERPEDYLTVNGENVADVVAALSRPMSYHQSLQVSNRSGEITNVSTVEVWARNGVMMISTASSDTVRYILTNGYDAYLWYDANPRNVVQTVLPHGMTIDDLIGIPTYEGLLHVGKNDIVDAGYVQLSTPADNPCIFAKIKHGDKTLETDWVDTDSGLLCKAELEIDGFVYETVEQTALELFDISDSSIRSVFYLPDGSEPFGFSLETEMPPA